MKNWRYFAGLAGLTFIAYGSLWRAGFVYDDRFTVVENTAIRSLSIPSFFKDAGTVASPESLMARDIYRPMATLSFALDYHLWGLNPIPFHAVNLLLHLLNGFLFWFLARRLLTSEPAALIAAAVFLVHPVQVEAVAWVTQRSTLLCALGVLSALLVLTRKEPLSWRGYAAGLAAWALGNFSKETAVVLPALAGLLDWVGSWQPNLRWERTRRRILYGIWFILVLPYWVIRNRVVREWSALLVTQRPLNVRLFLGAAAFPIYLGKMLWPMALRASYDTPVWDPVRFLYGAIIVVLFLAVLAWTLYRRHFLAIALGWIGLTLIPVLHLVPHFSPFFAERFLYLPVMGFALGVGWLYQQQKKSHAPILLWLAGLWGITLVTVPVWRSETALWTHAVQAEPSNAFAHACLAESLGDSPLAELQYFQALVNRPSDGIRFAAQQNLASLNHYWGNSRKADYWKKRAEEVKL